MNLRKYWPVAVLFAAVLLYFLGNGEEPAPINQVRQEKTPQTVPPIKAIEPPPMWDGQAGYQTPTTPPGGHPYGYPQAGQNSRFQTSLPSQYRFRPYDKEDSASKRYPDSYVRPRQDRGYPYAMPAPELQGYSRSGIDRAPDGVTTYRFRPLDEKRQSKRWVGNQAPKPTPRYQPPSPYPYENYPTPLNQVGPAVEKNPLWANSWPVR